jgi:hypothetical protein
MPRPSSTLSCIAALYFSFFISDMTQLASKRRTFLQYPEVGESETCP